MDFGSNNKRNRYFNIIFLGIFLAEIIIYIIGMVILPIRTDLLIIITSVFFMSGIYTIRKELDLCYLIYVALIIQGLCFLYYIWYITEAIPPISGILGLILLGLTFINTILCHRNFDKNLKFYFELMKFNPNLDKEFEYSNDLDDDDDDDDEE
ncbi:hypothetical protein C1646_661855 [Rhizophagus diaphanus]|nr:hypothetical protein C1646_661855 [Rhizophagus diaphanus] [Rhizophagus sp. MUCL 43196]